MMKMSVLWKFGVSAGICAGIALTSLGAVSYYYSKITQSTVSEKTSANIKQATIMQVSALASGEAEKIKGYFDKNFQRAEALAQTVSFFHTQSTSGVITDEALRRSLNNYVASLVNNYADVLGIYIISEPNVFAGNDASFVNNHDLASNDIGRFAPYWAKNEDGSIEFETMVEEDIGDTTLDDNGIAYNEWYTCSVRTKAACTLNPYIDWVGEQEMLMTSITVPVLAGGQVIAMVGIDVSLQALQPAIEKADKHFVDGKGHVVLFSPKGIIAAYDSDKTMLGKKISAIAMDKDRTLTQWLSDKTQQIRWNSANDALQAVIPVHLSADKAPWGIGFEVSRKEILASAIELDNSLTSLLYSSMRDTLIIGFFVVSLSILIIWYSSSLIVRPVLVLTEKLNEIAHASHWDLTQQLVVKNQDEFGRLTQGFNLFIQKLRSTVTNINRSVIKIQTTSEEAATISGNTRNSTAQQLQDIDAVLRLSESADTVAVNMQEESDKARQAQQSAMHGKNIAEQTSAAVGDLVDDVASIVPLIEKLSQDSKSIETILSVINEIAEQTNLLSLNAAIESARAGEHGRGFAVVATEVRGLAIRTMESVEQVRQVINIIQDGTRNVHTAVNSSNHKADQAITQVKEVSTALDMIAQEIAQIAAMGVETSEASSEQSHVIKDIVKNMSGIKDESSVISSQAKASESISADLNQLSTEQQSIVKQFVV